MWHRRNADLHNFIFSSYACRYHNMTPSKNKSTDLTVSTCHVDKDNHVEHGYL